MIFTATIFLDVHFQRQQTKVLSAEINIFKDDKSIVDESFISIEVPNVDKLYEQAQENEFGIVYELRNESWGVRRFFVKDPNGATINLLTHL